MVAGRARPRPGHPPPPPTAGVPAPSPRVGAPPAGAMGAPRLSLRGTARSTKRCQEGKSRFIGRLGRRAECVRQGWGGGSPGGRWAPGRCVGGVRRRGILWGDKGERPGSPPALAPPPPSLPPALSEPQDLAGLHCARCFYRLRVDRPEGNTESSGVRSGTPAPEQQGAAGDSPPWGCRSSPSLLASGADWARGSGNQPSPSNT